MRIVLATRVSAPTAAGIDDEDGRPRPIFMKFITP